MTTSMARPFTNTDLLPVTGGRAVDPKEKHDAS